MPSIKVSRIHSLSSQAAFKANTVIAKPIENVRPPNIFRFSALPTLLHI